jgi:outer membrane protein OmpU
MDKLKKIGLTALGTALVCSGAQAADMAVAGGAKITLTGGDKDTQGNGFTMLDSITFRASADMDNGWTVSTAQNLGRGAMNNSNMKINMGDMGTLEFHTLGGNSVAGSWDDMMPAANEETWHSAAAGSSSVLIAAGAGNDMFRYSVELMDGLTVLAGYMPSDGATSVEGSTSYGVQYTGIDGLEVGIAQDDNEEQVAVTNGNQTDSAAGAGIENTVMYAKYTFDSFTIGAQENSSDSETASADVDFSAFGISYAVSEDLSVSYGVSKMDLEGMAEDQEHAALGVSFTSGSMTISGSHHKHENGGGTATNDNDAYEINLAFAF